MASRKNLLSVDYHFDDDTGMYSIGEIDTGISINLTSYIEQYGEAGVKDILAGLAYLSGQVQEEFREVNKKYEVGQDCAKPSSHGQEDEEDDEEEQEY